MLRYKNIAITLIIALALSLPLISCAKKEVVGKLAPDFTIEKIGGGTLTLSELRGKPIIMYWFSSW